MATPFMPGSVWPSSRVSSGFGIPSVHVRGRSLGEDVQHALGFRRKMWLPRCQRVECGGSPRLGDQALTEEGGEAQRTHPHAEAVEKLPAGEEMIFESGGVMLRIHTSNDDQLMAQTMPGAKRFLQYPG